MARWVGGVIGWIFQEAVVGRLAHVFTHSLRHMFQVLTEAWDECL